MNGELPELEKRALSRICDEIKGNGLRNDEVELRSFEPQTLEFQAIIALELKTATTSRKQPGKAPGPQFIPSGAPGVQAAIQQENEKIRNTPATLERIRKTVLESPEAGPGMKDANISLPFLRQEYVHHETCGPCAGRGRSVCNRCQGKGNEQCPRCHGSATEHCPVCGGRQYVHDGQGNNQQCLRCNGSGKVPCTQCHQARTVQCPACKGKGNLTCQHCQGQTVNSIITTTEFSVQAHFEFEHTGLSPAVIQAITHAGTDLKNHAEILPAAAQTEEGKEELHIRYRIRLPIANAVFKIGEMEIPGFIFGLQAGLPGFPPFLETILHKDVAELESAVTSRTNLEEVLKRAGNVRTLRYALQASARWGKKKAAKILLQKFPLGLSKAEAERLAALAETALQNLSQKSRVFCRTLPILVMLAVYGSYAYGARPALLNLLPQPELKIAADIAIPLILAFIAFKLGQSCSRQSMEKRLQSLLSSNG